MEEYVYCVENDQLNELLNEQRRCRWLTDEFSFGEVAKPSNEILLCFKYVMSFLLRVDKMVNDLLGDIDLDELKCQDIARFHHEQMAIEDVHHQTYTRMILETDWFPIRELFDFGEDKLAAFKKYFEELLCVSSMKTKIAMSAALEGVMFGFAFSFFFWLRHGGRCLEFCKANEAIARDEQLHTRAWLVILKLSGWNEPQHMLTIVRKLIIIQQEIIIDFPQHIRSEISDGVFYFSRRFIDLYNETFPADPIRDHEQHSMPDYFFSSQTYTKTQFLDDAPSAYEYKFKHVEQKYPVD